jgi:pimeloyl-ACP methyl ester carboxylesterase
MFLFLMAFLWPLGVHAAADSPSGENVLPIIFVHGGSGSAAQFESQAMRFASNGYPADYITGYEYDSSLFGINEPEEWPAIIGALYPGIDQLVNEMLAKTGKDKVYMLGHSLGTFVMQSYLRSDPARAAKVAKYVNIDGAPADSLPGGVPTLAIWAGIRMAMDPAPSHEIIGATNVTIPNQTHVQVATSAESFVEMYKFFMGEEPVTDQILPDTDGVVKIGGRTVYFPENEGTNGFTLQVWELDGDTGMRIKGEPEHVCALGEDGAWGPLEVKRDTHYEFCVLRPEDEPYHIYFEPFLRDDYLIRLNTSKPGGRADHMEESANHTNIVIMRYKEFWGDQGEQNDVLEVDGTNIIIPEGCAQDSPTIAIFAYDVNSDGVTDLSAPEAYYDSVIFLTGVDLYVPAATPPNRSVSVVLTPRGGGGNKQVVNIPNWASSENRVIVQFNDYLQQPNTLYFAEGHTSQQFQEYLTLNNPHSLDALARVTYILPQGAEECVSYAVPARTRRTLNVNDELSARLGYSGDVGLKVQCELDIFVERPMYFDYFGKWKGGHVGRGADSLADKWYFAEGYTGGQFEMWVCILNPNEENAVCSFHFQTQEEEEEIVKESLVVPAHSRQTFNANQLLEGKAYNTSLLVESSLPVVAERAMYFSYAYGDLNAQGGSCVMGATDLSDAYFFAEGTTRDGFHEWITLQNPNDYEINVEAVYFPGQGQGDPITGSYTLKKQSRHTVFVPDVVGNAKDVSVSLYSADAFLAERPVYFTYAYGDLVAQGGDCEMGATGAHADWYLAEGYTGEGFQTWICIVNPFEDDVEAVVTYFTQEAGALEPKPVSVPAGRRVTLLVNEHAGPGYQLSAEVKVISGTGVVVERPMYFSYHGWDGGHVSLGFPL